MTDASCTDREQRFNDVVAAHLEAVESGESRDWRYLQERYPDLAVEIAAFFTEQEHLSSEVAPLRALVREATPSPAVADFAGLPENLELGDYRLVREIGRGGMGMVYEAEQKSLGRRVALKVLPWAATLDRQQLQRFHNEAHAAAQLHHTNIVPIFEVGCAGNVHYYAMQLIEGQALATLLRERRERRDQEKRRQGEEEKRRRGDQENGRQGEAASSSPLLPVSSSEYFRAVATLGIQAAEALDYAHERGVIHRDIKPANLLLDQRGQLWITDFGLAKAGGTSSDLTRTGDVVGTLRYLAPERFAGQADARSDVYSLGLTLYEMLTLQPAFADSDQHSLMRQVLNAEPAKPRQLDARIPRDLETIVLKAIAREPAHRYRSAAEVAEDLRRFLDDQPLLARRTSQLEHAWRWARRNPWLASMGAAIFLLLVVVAVGATVAAVRIDAAREEADQSAIKSQHAEKKAENEAEENRKSLVRMLVATGTQHLDEGDYLAAFPWFVEALKRDHKDPGREAMHRVRLGAVLRQAPKPVQMWFHEAASKAEFGADGRRVVTTDGESARVWDTATGEPLGPPLKHHPPRPNFFPARLAALSPDGLRVVLGSGNEKEGNTQVWDVATGKPVTPPLPHDACVRFVAFSRDGKHIVTASGINGFGGMARVWNGSTGEPITPWLEHNPELATAVFSPDGDRVLTAGLDGTARLWDVATGKLAAVMQHPMHQGANMVWHARFSPDGQHVVTASANRSSGIWNAETGAHRFTLKHDDWVRYAEFSSDSRFVVTASDDNSARVWNVATGAQVSPPLKHRVRVVRAAFSPDGRRVVTASMDTTARIWDVATGTEVMAPLRHIHGVEHVAFSPDGRRVLTASRDKAVRLWDISTGELSVTPLLPGDKLGAVALSPDGRCVLTRNDSDNSVRAWDVLTGKSISPPMSHDQAVQHMGFSPDSRFVATACKDGKARIWKVQTGEMTAALAHKAAARFVMFSPDGRRLITGSEDRMARVWDVTTGETLTPQPLPHDNVLSTTAAISADGRLAATADAAGAVRVWDVAGGKLIASARHKGSAAVASFSADGRRFLTWSHDGSAQLWDTATGAKASSPLQHSHLVAHAALSPDGRRVATASADGTARIWETATGKHLTPPLQHSGAVGFMGWVGHVGFSPDSRRLVSTSGVAVYVWDAGSGEPLTPPLKHGDNVWDRVFHPDGRRLITAGKDQTLRVWSLEANDWPMEDLVLMGQLLTGRRIDDTGALVPLDPASTRDDLRRAWETLRPKLGRRQALSP